MADFEVALSTEASGDNFCVSLWDINSGMQLKAYKGGCCPCRCVSLLGKDYILASQLNKPIIHVWNLAKDSILTKLICPGKVTAMMCSPDGVYCVVACGEKIYIWQVASGNLLALLSRHFQRVSCLKFTDDGSHFLSSGDDNLVMVWKMARVVSFSSSSLGTFDSNLSPRYTWSEHALPVTDIHCGHGGMRGHVITSSLDQTCKLYDLNSGELLCSFVFDIGVTAVVMDVAEQSFFAGCSDGSIYQVELFRRGMKNNIHTEKDEALIFNGHSKQVNSLAVSVDGTLLLSGSDDQTARVWHVHSKQCLREVKHKGAVTNTQIIRKPLYLENPPPKSSLPPIQPFKRHVHVPSQSREKHVTGHSGTAGGESTSDSIHLVLKGKLSEESSLERMEKSCGAMARPILNEVAKLEELGGAAGGKRQLSRRELEEELENVKRVNRNFYKFAVEELMTEVYQATEKNATAEPYFASVKSKVGMNKTRHQDEMNSHEKKEGDFKKAVKDSVDIDPSEKEEEDEPVIPQVKEVKVLPPIRNRTNTMAHISYTPKRVWGGSVSSYLDTIKRDSCADEDLLTGGKKRERRASSITQHTLRRGSQSGQLISWEKQVTVLGEVNETDDSVKTSALKKRRLSNRRNSELIPVSSN